MAKDLSKQDWHGVPRTEIPWYPTIDVDKCIGCQLCYVSCGREVFEMDDKNRKAVVEREYNCMVGCSTCATICPTAAISFPSREMIQKIEREHKVLKIARKKAWAKKTKSSYDQARAETEKLLLQITTRIDFEVTGHFAERKLMAKIYEAIKNDPCDLVFITVETPSLKGCWNEKAPSYAKFRLVSLEYEDIKPLSEKLKSVLKANDVVLISERQMG